MKQKLKKQGKIINFATVCKKKLAPWRESALTKCVLYKATVTKIGTNRQETYIGLTDNKFKTRYNLHKSSFKLEHKKSNTTLHKHIWNFKNKKDGYNIGWKILNQLKPSEPNKKVCYLYLEEKFKISTEKPTLKRKKESFSFCVYKKRFLLKNVITLPKLPDESNRAQNTSITPRPKPRYFILIYKYKYIYIHHTVNSLQKQR